eukprot:6404222-Alexandrium_andersonii.AAC.1
MSDLWLCVDSGIVVAAMPPPALLARALPAPVLPGLCPGNLGPGRGHDLPDTSWHPCAESW